MKLIDSGCEGAVHLVQCSRSELRDTKRLYALKTVFNIFGHQTVSKVCQCEGFRVVDIIFIFYVCDLVGLSAT